MRSTPLFNEQNFCDIYAELGKDALCDTCRMYPRHVEEYDGLRELSLSLSCPEAARIMLTCEEPTRFLTWETEEEEDSFEEDEMDFLLFTRLEDAREVMIRILQERSLDIRERIQLVEMLAEKMQQCVDESCDYEIDDVIASYETRLEQMVKDQAEESANARKLEDVGQTGVGAESDFSPMPDDTDFSAMLDDREASGDPRMSHAMDESERMDMAAEVYTHLCREFAVFEKMELLREEWGQTLKNMWSGLYAGGAKPYKEICRRFDASYGCDSPHRKQWQRIGEQLMVFFVYTYLCGAVYDDWIATKIRLAAFSVRWIQELVRYRWLENGERLTMDDVIEMSWRYAREVEHSDVNLEILEEWLEEQGGPHEE